MARCSSDSGLYCSRAALRLRHCLSRWRLTRFILNEFLSPPTPKRERNVQVVMTTCLSAAVTDIRISQPPNLSSWHLPPTPRALPTFNFRKRGQRFQILIWHHCANAWSLRLLKHISSLVSEKKTLPAQVTESVSAKFSRTFWNFYEMSGNKGKTSRMTANHIWW